MKLATSLLVFSLFLALGACSSGKKMSSDISDLKLVSVKTRCHLVPVKKSVVLVMADPNNTTKLYRYFVLLDATTQTQDRSLGNVQIQYNNQIIFIQSNPTDVVMTFKDNKDYARLPLKTDPQPLVLKGIGIAQYEVANDVSYEQFIIDLKNHKYDHQMQ